MYRSYTKWVMANRFVYTEISSSNSESVYTMAVIIKEVARDYMHQYEKCSTHTTKCTNHLWGVVVNFIGPWTFLAIIILLFGLHHAQPSVTVPVTDNFFVLIQFRNRSVNQTIIVEILLYCSFGWDGRWIVHERGMVLVCPVIPSAAVMVDCHLW